MEASPNETALVTRLQSGLRAGNRILVGPVPATGSALLDVASAEHDTATGRTTLTLHASTPVPHQLPTGTPVVVTAPVVWEQAAALATESPGVTPDPAILLSLSDLREDPGRGWSVPMRDSFRRRDGVTVCSLRPSPLPLAVEYQLLVIAGDDDQWNRILSGLIRALRTGTFLTVNGVDLPLRVLPARPAGRNRRLFARS